MAVSWVLNGVYGWKEYLALGRDASKARPALPEAVGAKVLPALPDVARPVRQHALAVIHHLPCISQQGPASVTMALHITCSCRHVVGTGNTSQRSGNAGSMHLCRLAACE